MKIGASERGAQSAAFAYQTWMRSLIFNTGGRTAHTDSAAGALGGADPRRRRRRIKKRRAGSLSLSLSLPACFFNHHNVLLRHFVADLVHPPSHRARVSCERIKFV